MEVEIQYPMLQGPIDGYDENDRWLGVTPEEVAVWLEEARGLSPTSSEVVPHGLEAESPRSPAIATAANRENAKRSTGSRSAMGKRRASANAHRHSLAIAIETMPEFSAEVERFERLLVGNQPSLELREAARRFALAQVDLCRIRRVRHEASRTMVENLEEWIDQIVPEFHFRGPADKSLRMVVTAARPSHAAATNAPRPVLAPWSRNTGPSRSPRKTCPLAPEGCSAGTPRLELGRDETNRRSIRTIAQAQNAARGGNEPRVSP